jgi:hypothetical protein
MIKAQQTQLESILAFGFTMTSARVAAGFGQDRLNLMLKRDRRRVVQTGESSGRSKRTALGVTRSSADAITGSDATTDSIPAIILIPRCQSIDVDFQSKSKLRKWKVQSGR